MTDRRALKDTTQLETARLDDTREPTGPSLESLAENAAIRDTVAIAMEALHRIIDMKHTGGPLCVPEAPLFECCCIRTMPGEIASEALKEIEEVCAAWRRI